MNGNDKLGRREFLKKAARTAAIGTVCGGIAYGKVPGDKKIGLADTIPTRVFGKTGVKLPILGYGGAALPKVWGNTLSTEDRVKLVRYAYDRGVRYFDTRSDRDSLCQGYHHVQQCVFEV